MKILIIEDDRDIVLLLSDELRSWGYEARGIDNFNNIIQEYKKYKPNLILMDITLPYYNGFYFTKEIRKISNVPIIFISSHNDSIEIVQAMQFGADDYITKPINIFVTREKIKALLRRTYDYTIDNDKLSYKNLILDLAKATLSGENFLFSLTRTELLILEVLFKNNKIATREEIINNCWQGENYIDDNTLAVNITRIRKKLKDNGIVDLIKTKKKIGYYLD
ncbi:response regulator transcription factor [Gemelliphila asaccharolytica]|uniref:Response regulator protein GraR n=1 Tax=Gemelliphila asaccharolytica TaxID=502393 RepID=A0ABR5TPD7_9BACL|nr:response regulator transcription factor [Gemella asaccharolytica]KXB58226.1 putative response regulator protein GraR [Gemella asaccharolytica]